ncbi:MAG TPA: hypothetical protein VMU71_08000 [Terracidiphilus sp.]|jgi:prevent-host-death family protein|nr:hypothetical protein [Terracidiphilus sp.]
MATVRISEAEAVRDLSGLLARVRAGEEVVIENGSSPEVVLSSVSAQRPGRLLSESIRIALENGFTATLDGSFEDDLNAVIASHQEPLDTSWD